MSQEYRTAFIGCGRRAREHAEALRGEKRCRVVALADIKREAAEAMNADYGYGAALYADYGELLARERPEVVVTCLWTPLHLPVFRACAEAGVKAVLAEKPMAPTWGDCLEMARLAEESGCQLTFSHQRRFAAGNLLVRRLIAEGRLGGIQRMDLYSPPNLLDCGTHTFDQALSFNNETPVKWVLGAVDASAPLNWFDVKSECMAAGILVFTNGVRASIQAGGPDMDIWGGIRIAGSEGFVEVFWDGNLGRAALYNDPAWRLPAVEADPAAQMRDMIANAFDCLASGAEPETSHRKALRAAEITFAFYESVRRHARVELPLAGVTDNPFLAMLAEGRFDLDRHGG